MRSLLGRPIALAALSTILVIACGEDEPSSGAPAPASVRRTRAAATATADGPVCRGTGAHDKHGLVGFQCATCHECGGLMQFSSTYTLPTSGASISGPENVVTVGANGTTCSVACHNVGGLATTQPVDWSAPGPLACSSCHSQGQAGAFPVRSSHGVDSSSATANRAACQNCHDTSRHVSGTVVIQGVGALDPNDPAQVDGACKKCHGGRGTAVAGKTPPLLVGYASADGDFHGARAGTGFGGSLIGYARGAGPLPCVTCHDAHQSSNAFLFASNVNTSPVADATINRAGVGAEALCERCHSGARHAGCNAAGCHTTDPVPGGANKPCFFCHGHEGIVNFKLPTWADHPVPGVAISDPNAYCWHCHTAGWFPAAPEYVAPTVTNVVVTEVTGTSAKVSWTTNEKATSYVEWGVGTPSNVDGNGLLVTQPCGPGVSTPCREVTLTGLAPLTQYAYRVRSSDAMRNATVSQIYTFTTPDPNAPGQPALTPVDDGAVPYPETAVPVTFQWAAVADPNGDPVEYRIQISSNPGFTAPLVFDGPWTPSTTYAKTFTATEWPGATYYWRVQARDAAHDLRSPWSSVDAFGIWWYDPMPY
ncbi:MULTISPECIES: fibronectin type III domain-containing protein [Anaeromyxobacter]|uniref:fibronectin type III domain-containing protein n=1 Tax=Anaeromyxobacter TaxID=161492 RepID=UPI001F56851C|nr:MULTISPECIES: fibronectin type III domain-containing protein [unclassified Anaeromyxobacter]